jgi:hypothetical protein
LLYAIDRSTGQRIAAEEFQKRHSKKTTTGLVDIPAECPYCHKDLFLRQGTKTIHFWHGTSKEFCPSKEPFGRPYIHLTPTEPDLVHAAALRTKFKEEWQLHYMELLRLIPCMSYQEFLLLLGEALSKDIFAYANMTIGDVPYVMVLALDYVPKTSYKQQRNLWFRFWYSAKIRQIDQLWIVPPADVELIRASFVPPTAPARFPDYDTGLIADKPMVRTAFREATFPQLHSLIVDKVTNWFRRHPTF